MIKNEEYFGPLWPVYVREMGLLRERFENGDTATAVMELLQTMTKSKM